MNEHQTSGAAQVIVGTDGTHTAARAIAWAATEARLRGGPLRIVHAAPYATVDNKPERRRVTTILRRAYTVAHQHEPRVPAHAEVIDDQPVRALVDASRNAQLLVVGMRRERSGQVLIGSTALAVSATAPCPVTVVRGQPHPADPTAPVLLGIKDVEIDAPAVTTAFAHAHRRRAPLIVLHATHNSPRDPITDHNTAQDLLVEQLAPWHSQYPQVFAKIRFAHGRPIDQLLRAAATARLVVVGTHGRGAPARLLLDSTSRAVVRYSPCPVTVVRWDAIIRDTARDPATSVTQVAAGGPLPADRLHDRIQ